MLSQMGNVMMEPVKLIVEGASVLTQEIQMYRKNGILGEDEGTVGTTALPKYSTYEARLKQFMGQVEFIKLFCEDDREWKYLALQRAIDKLADLFRLARYYKYDVDHFESWVDEYARCCMNVIDVEIIDEDQKMKLLEFVYELCVWLLDVHRQMGVDSLNEAL